MLDKKTTGDILTAATATGADFAEIFMEQTERSSIQLTNGVVDRALSGLDYGIGIRIFNGTNAIYTYTSNTEKENVIKMAKEAAASVKGNRKESPLSLCHVYTQNHHAIQIMPFDVSKNRKVALMKEAAHSASNYDIIISQTSVSYLEYVQNVFIANTSGRMVNDRRVRTRFTIEAVATSAMEKQSGYFGPGGHVGFELFDAINVQEVGRQAARIAVTMLKADKCPRGFMPVVIDNGFGGVLFHEACGHSLEATAIAKGLSVFCGRLGESIASPLVTAIDDGTIPNGWGSSNIDDEGNATQKNILIENGILKGYLIDELNARKMGGKATGSARRQSYQFAPTSRMTNTYIDAGESSLSEIIADTEYGLYAKHMGGGSVEPTTGAFNFAVLEGYMIRNGKIAEPVRGATLIGKGHEVLLKIDKVGNNLSRGQGMCGSVSGSVPTDVGQPAIRISDISVGGRG